MSNKPVISAETQQAAINIAKATQKPWQTKEQTKLIAQGIEKGIAEFKKQQKAKARERNKLQKKRANAAAVALDVDDEALDDFAPAPSWLRGLPWGLLLLSWIGFGLYLLA
ncbi:DUF2956 domain-containing protein [Shewanella avicenniae]|uniref:DUF2956 domain-containing protein n=1 Tax=Shewanella avicenniae TaxID=2814294 RepID=A0ABX7QTD9_9GAMM|nr:DUF2956 domain-containing protein [Shewanella avicenniae]QSX34255.1 DUF2956 domain-containing protein [Shewanella avicenniae]